MKIVKFREPKSVEIRIDRQGHYIEVADPAGMVHSFNLSHRDGEGVHWFSGPDDFREVDE